MRAAITSSNGKFVDTSFCQAKIFYIYEVRNKMRFFVEIRKTFESINSKNKTAFDEDNFEKICNIIKDCQLLYTAQIGNKSAHLLKRKGILSLAVQEDIRELFN